MKGLDLYNAFRNVPKEAQKEIRGGKLNGKTDINPMWRIKVLTDTFGPCGFGWYTEMLEHWTERDDYAGESCAWVKTALYIKDAETGEWSKPIIGVGGNKQAGKGKGDGINDEAFKMAETDAISVCCKKLGMGADIYWDGDSTKYTNGGLNRAATSPSTDKAVQPATRPLDAFEIARKYEKDNGFWQAVEGFVDGIKPSKNYATCRDWFIGNRKPSQEELAYFDKQVAMRRTAIKQ